MLSLQTFTKNSSRLGWFICFWHPC